jgi:putative DNA primase/helicase
MTDERPPRPDPLGVDPDGIPETLTEREAWVCWRFKYDTGRDEWTKVPVDPNTGAFASSTDPDTWASFATALGVHDGGATDTDGVGFVLHDDDTVLGLDLDDCRDRNTGDLEAWADDVLDDVPTYAEASPSGTGVHLLGHGFVPDDGGTRGDVDGGDGHLEMYDTGRYLTVTGQHIDGSPEDTRQVHNEIRAVHAEHIADDPADPDPPKPADGGAVDTQTSGSNPTPGADTSDLSDDEILGKAKNAENGDKFRELWIGDTTRYESHSEADLALVGLLAFWTGGDRQQMDRLFRRSDLYRDKWDEDRGNQTYGERTIDKALSGRSDFYDPDAHDGATPNRPNDPGGDVDHADGAGDDDTKRWLTPTQVKLQAGLDDDEPLAELSDREKAACVWWLLKRGDRLHVRVRRDNGSLWAYDAGVWKPEGERALRHAARSALGAMNYGANVLAELKAQARSDPRVEVEADEFGLSPGTIAVENGLVYLDAAADGAADDALRDLEPEDYALTRLPVEYDPGATADEWKEFVGDVVEPEKIDAVQEYVGYALHRGAMPYSKALLLVGSGSNGKTTFLNVIRSLLGGDHTTTKPVHKFDEDNHVADLYGALANIDADLSEGSLSSEGIATFKRLVGGDKIDARKLYEDAFTFKPTAKHLYACNQVPDVSAYVSDHDVAFWRRWIVVEFPNYFPPAERDPDLEDRLTTDGTLSGVLNWAIQGWGRLRDQDDFTNVESHDETRRLWQSWGESVEQFIAECVDRDEDADPITTGDAYARYQAWCRQNGADPVGRRRFTDTLKQEDVDYGRHRIDGKAQRGYKSLGFSEDVPELKNDTDDDDRDAGKGSQARFG